MRIPAFISKGDIIGVTAPSYSASRKNDGIRFDNAVRKLHEIGHDIKMTSDVYGFGEEELRAPAKLRAEELESLFSDDDVKAVIMAKGGDYEFEILDLLDWTTIENNPKWVQGYSDNTSFLLKYTVEHDVPTIYCGNFGDFGMDVWHRSVSDNMAFLEGRLNEQSSFQYHEAGFHDRVTQLEGIYDDEITYWHCNKGDCRFSGTLLGGCMDVLALFIRNGDLDVNGFLDRHDGDIIWYMETFAMSDERINRLFKNMNDRGWFERTSGFVFGRELFYDGNSYECIVSKCLSDFDVPIVFGADVGHKAPRMVFVNGLNAEFQIFDGKCTIKYDY